MTLALLQAAPGSDVTAHLRGIVDGAGFLLQSALSLAAAVATVLALAPMPARRAIACTALFALAAIAVRWLPPAVPGGLLAPAVLLSLGAVIATGFRLRGWLAAMAIAVGGIAAGAAGGFETATWEEMLGGVLVLGVLAVAGLLVIGHVVLPARIVRPATLARRMAGAWIAAVGMLLVALWLRRGG